MQTTRRRQCSQRVINAPKFGAMRQSPNIAYLVPGTDLRMTNIYIEDQTSNIGYRQLNPPFISLHTLMQSSIQPALAHSFNTPHNRFDRRPTPASKALLKVSRAPEAEPAFSFLNNDDGASRNV